MSDNARIFTPRHAVTDERLQLELSETSDPIPGRGHWVRLVCDSRGQRWLAWGAPCGAGCHCDAIAIEARDLDTLSANRAGDFNEAMEAIR
jgi:hypothetical protein